MDDGVTPQCASVDIMEANIWGFKTQSSPCEFGECDQANQCQRKATDATNGSEYGPGSDYLVNSNESYHVRTEFWTMAEGDSYTDLYEIRTTLTQGESTVVISQDCEGNMAGLTGRMNSMAIGISLTDVGKVNDVAYGECGWECSEYVDEEEPVTKISNIVWSSDNSVT